MKSAAGHTNRSRTTMYLVLICILSLSLIPFSNIDVTTLGPIGCSSSSRYNETEIAADQTSIILKAKDFFQRAQQQSEWVTQGPLFEKRADGDDDGDDGNDDDGEDEDNSSSQVSNSTNYSASSSYGSSSSISSSYLSSSSSSSSSASSSSSQSSSSSSSASPSSSYSSTLASSTSSTAESSSAASSESSSTSSSSEEVSSTTSSSSESSSDYSSTTSESSNTVYTSVSTSGSQQVTVTVTETPTSASSSSSATSASPSLSTSSKDSSSSSSGLSSKDKIIIGCVVGIGVPFLLLLAFLAYWFGYKKRSGSSMNSQHSGSDSITSFKNENIVGDSASHTGELQTQNNDGYDVEELAGNTYRGSSKINPSTNF